MLKNCKICKKPFINFLSLGNQPCADTFLKSKKLSINLKKFPIDVGFCKFSHMSAIYPITGFLRYEKYDYSYTLYLLFQEHISKRLLILYVKDLRLTKKVCKKLEVMMEL